MLILSFSYR